MPLQPSGPAPYTSANAVVTVLDAWRDRGFGVPVTTDTLARAGVSESIARRTFQSLVGLELLNEDGTPTEQLQDFRATRGDDEYRNRLQEWLRSVYADVLQYADPSTDPYERVTEAFRTYEPAGQRRAMASLLLGLWKYAGLPVPEGQTPAARPSRPRPAAPSRSTRQTRTRPPKPTEAANDLPPALVGLLRQLPRDGWTAEERENFLIAFTAVLDFAVPIRTTRDQEVNKEVDA